MSDQSVFDTNNNNSQETPEIKDSQSSNVFSDLLNSITNEEGKPKYNSVEEALKGAANAQEYIRQLKEKQEALESNLTQAQQQLAKSEAIEDVVSRLSANQNQEPQATPDSQGLDEQTIANLINKQLAEKSLQEAATLNKDKVNGELFSKFGDKAPEVVNSKAKELNISVNQLEEMSKQSPQLVLSLFGLTQSNLKSGPTTTTTSYTPPEGDKSTDLEKPTKSLLAGASSKEQAEYMAKIRQRVYEKYDVQTS